jgi:hypothetical protein
MKRFIGLALPLSAIVFASSAASAQAPAGASESAAKPVQPAQAAPPKEQPTGDIKTQQSPAVPAASGAAAKAITSFSGEAVLPSVVAYDQVLEVAGHRVEGTLTRTISQEQLNGRATWKVLESSKTTMVSGDDTLWLDAKTLMPLKRSLKQGVATLELSVADGHVKGEIKIGTTQQPIDAKLDGPALFDGANIELAVASLPLAAGYRATFKSFNVTNSKVQTWTAEEVATEKLPLGSLSFDVHRVKLSSDDDNTVVLWIEAANSRRLIKSEANVATQMGAAKVTKAMQPAAGTAPSSSR